MQYSGEIMVLDKGFVVKNMNLQLFMLLNLRKTMSFFPFQSDTTNKTGIFELLILIYKELIMLSTVSGVIKFEVLITPES